MPIKIMPFHPREAGDEELRAYYELYISITAHDLPERPIPTYDVVINQARADVDNATRFTHHWVAYDGSRLVGTLLTEFVRLEHLRHSAAIQSRVLPSERRRGIATSLLAAAVPTIQEFGRDTVTALSVVEGRDGAAAARALGLRVVWESYMQLLTFPDGLVAVDPQLPEGCRIELWHGSVPDRYLASYTEAVNLIRDAPSQDSSLVNVDWTPRRLRDWEADLASTNVERHVAAAIGPDDHVLATTSARIAASRPGWVMQDDTVVARSHRGKGLATAVKAANLGWIAAHRPEAKEAATWVARTNPAMLQVNRRLGFHDVFLNLDFEIATQDLVDRLGARQRVRRDVDGS